jgi:pSer/pThr/pTyr-binding forkhead associated (FHA) protein
MSHTTPVADVGTDVTQVLDALPRVDHRSRRRGTTVARPDAGRYLVLDDGDEEALLLPLDRAVTHIGRGFGMDIRLEDAGVSRRHALVVQRRSGARVLDDRSANGTFVNGRRVSEADLSDGDVIVIGRVVLRYVDIA